MINGNTIHYISSGMNHTRINSMEDQRTIDWVKHGIRKLTTDNYQFGFLYNAYTEKNLGQLFSSTYSDVLCDIHADSGGLQMITLGHQITPEMKMDIYRHQAQHSTIAMSFDEIPVTSSGVLDFANRRFNAHLVEEKAIQSGKNLVDQLKLFAAEKTKAKPLLIAQGNDMETYCKWVDIVQKQIPSELLPMLGGVALAGSSMGNGDLENVRTAFYYTQMDLKFDCKQVHLLGVGSISRFIPTMVFMKSGLYKDLVISIDSTTHTGNVSRNSYYNEQCEVVKLGRLYDPFEYEKLFNFCKFFDIDIQSARELFEVISSGPTYSELKEIAGNDDAVHKYLQGKFAVFFVSAKNTLDAFTDYLNDKNVLTHTRKHMLMPMKHLQEVKTLQDYLVWERNFAHYLPSNAVPNTEVCSLDEFF